ncbi:tRNA pseudouridine(55) synthase TruB [Candidatus Saccharibacteria bacterium]|nr:tRNA pseudouridine(55) synthase TruB [Candidatus Saccharibacteria bacterium]
MEDDILWVDKPAGMSSFGVVARVRRKLSEAAGHKVKVGHTGTLDPFATGLMILLAGKGTKRADEFSKLDKIYEAKIRLGATSTTGDPEGEITEKGISENVATPEKTLPEAGFLGDKAGSKKYLSRIFHVVSSFIGEIEQTPPVFSAIKINGQRAYKLARKGVEVEMPKRKVQIYSIEILDYAWPYLTIRAHVGSGTYIRSLAVDIGEKLGCGAYVVELRRTRVGTYDLKDVNMVVI